MRLWNQWSREFCNTHCHRILVSALFADTSSLLTVFISKKKKIFFSLVSFSFCTLSDSWLQYWIGILYTSDWHPQVPLYLHLSRGRAFAQYSTQLFLINYQAVTVSYNNSMVSCNKFSYWIWLTFKIWKCSSGNDIRSLTHKLVFNCACRIDSVKMAVAT